MNMHDAVSIDLEGKVCVVTGANGGIGQSICQHFLALGANVMATDIAPVTSLPINNVARASAFLVSQQSAYITAQTINVDGGNVLR